MLGLLLLLLPVVVVALQHLQTSGGQTRTGKTAAPQAGVLPGDVAGFRAALASGLGRPVVVNFWASWCGPCYEEAPALATLSRRYGAGVTFVGVAVLDRPQEAADFLRRFDIPYITLLDQSGTIAASEAIPGLPVTRLYAQDGSLARTWVGAVNVMQLEAALAGLQPSGATWSPSTTAPRGGGTSSS